MFNEKKNFFVILPYRLFQAVKNEKVAEATAVTITWRRKFVTNKLIVKIPCTDVAVTQVSAIINKLCNSKQNPGVPK